ncbi:competence/damage-inducible protein A [Tenacibaculum sp. M341]|uniref:competence/damage-inducible protein A n=1 Tax=Tenacibaculum sp. M341 TaxID=2530339 RepID=UPI001050BB89|nr:competence/damage-inducible protein A [Tenacibaculum sp. M341]TCI92666.1 competence/damage-inducible protein A [Tenacibaculum sp. M341]
MNAEIITIGDEILIGQIVDTNSQWIGQELNKIGVSVYQISSIQDEKQHILNALKEAENRVDIVIITGGLGPTNDDITKITIAEYFNDTELVNYPEITQHIKELFKRFDVPYVHESQKGQALLPSKATLLKNRLGTAAGMWFYENNTVFVSLPGVPYEMKGLMTNEVLPKLQTTFELPFIYHKTIHTVGQGETAIANRIVDFENNLPSFIKLAYLPSFGRVRLRLSAKGIDKVLLEETLALELEKLKELLPDIIVGFDADTLEKQVGEKFKSENKTLATAESLTGGKIASALVSVPGASGYFKGGMVVYSALLKQSLLDIPKELIEEKSVVSKEVAELMAINARKKMQTDFAVSVTGNAGPTKDNNDKEVGLVYIGIATNTGVEVHEFNFGSPREKVINKTVNKALSLLLKNNT